MRFLVFATLLLFANGSIHVNKTHNAQYEASESQHHVQEWFGAQNFEIAIRDIDVDGQQSNSYDASKDCLYRIYLLATIIGVAAGIAGIIAIYKQTRATKEAATAAKDSADAAQKSAKALVNSERAWILVELGKLEDVEHKYPFITEGYSSENGPSTTFYAEITLTNEGRSPCWITDVRLKFEIVKVLQEIPDFTDSPTEKGCVGTSLGTKGEGYSFVWMPFFKGREDETTLTVAYGMIEYRDIFGENRTTTFGFEVVRDDPRTRSLERLTDYPKYNEHT